MSMTKTVKPSVHYAPHGFHVLCGADRSNQQTTTVASHVTCWVCLERMPRDYSGNLRPPMCPCGRGPLLPTPSLMDER